MEAQKMEKNAAAQVNPVTLAFLGDAVYTLYIRDKLVRSGTGKAADFQRASAKIVSARGQSAFLERLLPIFTEEESDIFRRGRNAKKPTKSKHASVAEYTRSTGFEAVIGFLYLTGEHERINELFSYIDEENLKGESVQKAYKP
jgi:ribonuclease-3 family protein